MKKPTTKNLNLPIKPFFSEIKGNSFDNLDHLAKASDNDSLSPPRDDHAETEHSGYEVELDDYSLDSPGRRSPVRERPQNFSAQKCLFCTERAPCTVFLNCGHAVCCFECSVIISKSIGKCFLCNNKIDIAVSVRELTISWTVEKVIKAICDEELKDGEFHEI